MRIFIIITVLSNSRMWRKLPTAKRISKEYCWDIAWFCISKVLFTFEGAQLATNMWPSNWGHATNWPSTIMHSSYFCHILSCTAAQQQTSQKYLLIGYSASKWGLHKIALNTKSTNFYKIKLFYTFFWLQQIWPKRVMTFGGSKQNRVGEIKYKTHLIQHSQKHLQQQKVTNALRAAIQMSFETRNLHQWMFDNCLFPPFITWNYVFYYTILFYFSFYI